MSTASAGRVPVVIFRASCLLLGLLAPLGLAAAQVPPAGAVRDHAQELTAPAPWSLTAAGLGLVPHNILALPAATEHALVADLGRNRLYLFAHREGELSLLREMYLSIGKAGYGKRVEGDMLSPVGVYTITEYIPGEKLPPLYGDGAWPVDYPNPLDAFEGRNGYGIWLHGNPPDAAWRAPRSSEGCLTLANADLNGLHAFIELRRTPLVFADEVRWITPEAQAAQLAELRGALEEWQIAWESLDADLLGGHYAENARVAGMSRAQFIEQKRQVNAGKSWLQVRLLELSAYRYPGDGPARWQVEFQQDYSSNNFSGQSRKRQYWEKQPDGRWRILLEIPTT